MHKKNTMPEQKQEIPTLEERLAEHPLLDWAKKNGTNLFLGIAIVLALVFLIYKMSSRDQIQSGADYFAAQKNIQILTGETDATEPVRLDALRQLKEIIDQRPSLNSKYDAPIAQALIFENEGGEAQIFAKRTFKRTEKNALPQYTEMGKISLLIGEGNYQEALEQATTLKKEMDENLEKSGNDALYAYNLLQIAALQQNLNNSAAELQAWSDVKDYLFAGDAEGPTANVQTSVLIQNIFAEGSTSLKDYIKERESILRNNVDRG